MPSPWQTNRTVTICWYITLDIVKLLAHGVKWHWHLRKCRTMHISCQRAIAIHNRPRILIPPNWSKHGLTSHDMKQVTACSVAQADHPPRRVRRLNEVGMTQSLYLTILHFHIEVREDRIGTIRFVRSKEVTATQDVDMMPLLGSSLGKHQVVIAILTVNMRTFWITPTKTSAQMMNLSNLLACFHVYFANLYVTFFPKEIALVPLEIECRVATADSKVYDYRLRPFAGWIICPYIEVATRRKDRCHHIKTPFMLSYSSCINASIRPPQFWMVLFIKTCEVELGRSSQAVAYLLPMDKVFRMKHGHAREVLERAVDEIEVVACTAYTWVGVEAWQHGILEPLVRCGQSLRTCRCHLHRQRN